MGNHTVSPQTRWPVLRDFSAGYVGDRCHHVGVTQPVNSEQAAWLALVVTGRDRRGGERYDDDPASHYSWDSTVPNRNAVQAGHVLVLWDSDSLLGASVIEQIDSGTREKTVGRCRSCEGSNYEQRKALTPRYRCYQCKAEFDEPLMRVKEVRTYRSEHRAGWVDLDGALSGTELRELCQSPRSQLSIRGLDWGRFQVALRAAHPDLPVGLINAAAARIREGHKEATVRVRLGQADFRRRLLGRYGEVCAFTGHAPVTVLEAAHLYSYAAEGKHHDDGGLLLRRDLHRLFDLGLIALHPANGRLDVAEELKPYPEYKQLHGAAMHVELTDAQCGFLRRHWEQHRNTPSA